MYTSIYLVIIDVILQLRYDFIKFFIFPQAVKDDIGTVRVQRPRKGPFYVSHQTIDQLIANLRKWARLVCPCT